MNEVSLVMPRDVELANENERLLRVIEDLKNQLVDARETRAENMAAPTEWEEDKSEILGELATLRGTVVDLNNQLANAEKKLKEPIQFELEARLLRENIRDLRFALELIDSTRCNS